MMKYRVKSVLSLVQSTSLEKSLKSKKFCFKHKQPRRKWVKLLQRLRRSIRRKRKLLQLMLHEKAEDDKDYKQTLNALPKRRMFRKWRKWQRILKIMRKHRKKQSKKIRALKHRMILLLERLKVAYRKRCSRPPRSRRQKLKIIREEPSKISRRKKVKRFNRHNRPRNSKEKNPKISLEIAKDLRKIRIPTTNRRRGKKRPSQDEANAIYENADNKIGKFFNKRISSERKRRGRLGRVNTRRLSQESANDLENKRFRRGRQKRLSQDEVNSTVENLDKKVERRTSFQRKRRKRVSQVITGRLSQESAIDSGKRGSRRGRKKRPSKHEENVLDEHTDNKVVTKRTSRNKSRGRLGQDTTGHFSAEITGQVSEENSKRHSLKSAGGLSEKSSGRLSLKSVGGLSLKSTGYGKRRTTKKASSHYLLKDSKVEKENLVLKRRKEKAMITETESEAELIPSVSTRKFSEDKEKLKLEQAKAAAAKALSNSLKLRLSNLPLNFTESDTPSNNKLKDIPLEGLAGVKSLKELRAISSAQKLLEKPGTSKKITSQYELSLLELLPLQSANENNICSSSSMEVAEANSQKTIDDARKRYEQLKSFRRGRQSYFNRMKLSGKGTVIAQYKKPITKSGVEKDKPDFVPSSNRSSYIQMGSYLQRDDNDMDMNTNRYWSFSRTYMYNDDFDDSRLLSSFDEFEFAENEKFPEPVVEPVVEPAPKPKHAKINVQANTRVSRKSEYLSIPAVVRYNDIMKHKRSSTHPKYISKGQWVDVPLPKVDEVPKIVPSCGMPCCLPHEGENRDCCKFTPLMLLHKAKQKRLEASNSAPALHYDSKI